MRAKLEGGGVKKFKRVGFDVDDAVLVLQLAVDLEELAARDENAFSARRAVGWMMTLLMPVSSSMERKMKPSAVPGRWRAMTAPAAMHAAAIGMLLQFACGEDALARAVRARRKAMGCGPVVRPVPA